MKKARSRLALVTKAITGGLAPEASLKLWRTLIQPILEYGVGIWGSTRWPEAEPIQLELGRLILGVGNHTALDGVRGELGLWTMAGRFKLAILRWWSKLIVMDPNRLCHRVYRYRRNKIRENRNSWCKVVRNLLEQLHLEHVWEDERIGEVNITACIRDSETRSWKERLLAKPKLRLYRLLKMELCFEQYLVEISESHSRRDFTRIRSGTHQLRIETGRYQKEGLCCIFAKEWWRMRFISFLNVYLTSRSEEQCSVQFENRLGITTSFPDYLLTKWWTFSSVTGCRTQCTTE